jgi:hypothetical protein
MMNIETLVLVWPFFMIGLAVGVVLLAHRWFDRREQRQHPAE